MVTKLDKKGERKRERERERGMCKEGLWTVSKSVLRVTFRGL